MCTVSNSLGRPDLIFDGTNFLVVWDDYSSGAPYHGEIYCARVDTSANVLAPGRLPVSAAGGFWPRYEPCIAFDGAKSLVLWTDSRIDFEFEESDVFGARVLTDGTVVGAEEKVVSRAVNDVQRYTHCCRAQAARRLVLAAP